MRRMLLTIALALVAAPTLATIRPCSAALVTAGLCSGATDRLLSYSVPLDVAPRLAAALAAEAGYVAELRCEAERIVDEAGILRTAGPGDGTCTAELAGTEIANPQTAAVVADRHLRRKLVVLIRGEEEREAVRAAEEAARATERVKADPAISD